MAETFGDASERSERQQQFIMPEAGDVESPKKEKVPPKVEPAPVQA